MQGKTAIGQFQDKIRLRHFPSLHRDLGTVGQGNLATEPEEGLSQTQRRIQRGMQVRAVTTEFRVWDHPNKDVQVTGFFVLGRFIGHALQDDAVPVGDARWNVKFELFLLLDDLSAGAFRTDRLEGLALSRTFGALCLELLDHPQANVLLDDASPRPPAVRTLDNVLGVLCPDALALRAQFAPLDGNAVIADALCHIPQPNAHLDSCWRTLALPPVLVIPCAKATAEMESISKDPTSI